MTTAIHAESLDWKQSTDKHRTGMLYAKSLASGEEVGGINFWFSMIRYGEGEQAWEVPAHRHVFDQIRFALDCDTSYAAKKDIPKGWCGYFPAGAHYGPQHNDGGTIVLLQFGEHFLTNAKFEQATLELQKSGQFENGVYTYHDADGKKHNRDGSEAVYQHIFGRKVEYPKPQYAEPILMNPGAFEWLPSGQGTWHKPLGTFGDKDLRISALKWDKGGVHELKSDRTQFVFTLRGTIEVEGKSYPAPAAVVSEFGSSTRIRASEDAEAYCASMPLGSFAAR